MTSPKKIQYKCPRCNRNVETTKVIKGIKSITYFLSCGHISKEALIETVESEIISIDGKSPFPFQNKGIEFIEQSSARCLIADEMGLGKTIQALGFITKHLDEFTPALIICKSALTVQWMYESLRWIKLPAFIIKSGKSRLFNGFKLYIISYDLLRRLPENYFDSIEFKLVILDECQHIKSHESQRTNEVRKLVKKANHVIALSGTPIKNRVSEYFPVLNMLRPDLFRNRDHFISHWVNTYHDGYKTVEAGLYRPDEFFDLTKDFIIRRTRDEVLPDLPKVQRNFRYVEFEGGFQESYNKTVKAFLKYMDEEPDPFSFENYSNTLAYIAKMRHICGLAKVAPTFDYINDFLLETERKITIFVHHHAVAQLLKAQLNDAHVSTLEISSAMDAEAKTRAIDEFRDGQTRVMIASTLSSGEGLNLQFSSDMIMMERQWNPANEEQCEARFARIGQVNQINANYIVAIDTIDEYLTKLIEQKRSVFAEVMTGESFAWSETDVIKELTEMIYKQGRQEFKQ